VEKQIKVLIVEDSEDDALLMVRELERDGFVPRWRRVETAAGLGEALDEGGWDVILADYSLPGFTGAEALAMVRGRGLDVPFIIVSGSSGEELAVEMMRDGADDYFLKGMLRLLPGAVRRELREAEARRGRWEAEERLRLLTRALEASANAVVLADRDGIIQWVNPAFTYLTGYELQEALGQNPRVLKSGVQPQSFYGEMWDTILAGKVWHGELVNKRKDGTLYTEEMTITPVMDDAGEITHFIAIKQDVTGRKRMEEALRESEERYRDLVEHSHEIIGTHALDGAILSLNRAVEEILGLPREQVVGTSFRDLVVPEHRHEVDDYLRRIAEEGEAAGIMRVVRPDGTERLWDYRTSLRREGVDEPVVRCVIRDITEEWQAQKELEESEERYRDLVEKAGIAIMVDDEQGRMTYCNRRLGELFGYSEEELAGMAIGRLVAPEDRDRVIALHRAHFTGESAPWSYRFRGIRRDETILRLAVDVTPLVRDGRTVGTRSYIRDVTEEELVQAQLLQAQKMESVGRLAGGVAHDFNNILQAILAHADMALGDPGDVSQLEEHLREIRTAAERAANLTRQLLTFSRREELHPKVLDLNELTAGLLKMIRRVIGEDIEVVFEPGAGEPAVVADPGQLEQVLLNLAVNARDAMPGGGRLAISTSIEPPHVALRVADTGCGMNEETRERIFEPFFTTKEREQGTGLGLATVYGIVRRHNGTIEVESEPGRGATFTVLLPVSANAPTGERTPDRSGAHRGTETILVAEDDPMVCEVLVGVLRGAGYTVLEAEDGAKAVELFTAHAEKVQLVVLDALMPRMDGAEAAAKIRQLRPDLPVLFSSGYSGGALGTNHSIPPDAEILTKPYSTAGLLSAVRRLLDAVADAPLSRSPD